MRACYREPGQQIGAGPFHPRWLSFKNTIPEDFSLPVSEHDEVAELAHSSQTWGSKAMPANSVGTRSMW